MMDQYIYNLCMMLLHEIHVFELQIEMNSQWMILTVINNY